MKYEGHTPGPWFTPDTTSGSGMSVLAKQPSGAIGLLIAKVYGTEAGSALANARLFADAPLLLAQRDRLLEFANGIDTMA